eukprot:gene7881-10039_t
MQTPETIFAWVDKYGIFADFELGPVGIFKHPGLSFYKSDDVYPMFTSHKYNDLILVLNRLDELTRLHHPALLSAMLNKPALFHDKDLVRTATLFEVEVRPDAAFEDIQAFKANLFDISAVFSPKCLSDTSDCCA